jgi:hypothetical protein
MKCAAPTAPCPDTEAAVVSSIFRKFLRGSPASSPRAVEARP